MVRKSVVVQLNEGLEARPTALLVQQASQYSSKVNIEVGTKVINAKSIMGMMSLQLSAGDSVTIITEGEDEEIAAEGMEKFLMGIK